jgi:hypothetical protein
MNSGSQKPSCPYVRLMQQRPVGYMLAFLFFFELATTFDEPRFIAMSVFKDALSK